MPIADDPPGLGVKSAERTLDVLELLASTQEHLTLSELSRRLGLPKSSLHKLLRTMERRGWVETDELSGTRYQIGLRALLAGTRYVDVDEVVQLAEPILTALSGRFQEATHLGRLDGPNVVYLAKRESAHPLRMLSAVGRRLPAHATALGKAMLTKRPWAEVEALLPAQLVALTGNTITTRAALRRELEKVRELGYAVDDQESAEMMRAVAVALPQVTGSVNAVSISAPVIRLPLEEIEGIAQAIHESIGAVHRFQAVS